MRKRMVKKLMAAATALLLTIGSVMPAFATGNTPSIQPIVGESTITLHLYGSNSESDKIGTGTTEDAVNLPNGSEPIEGATFKYLQVGTVIQYNNGSVAGIRYEITSEAFAEAVGITTQNAETINGNAYIVPDTLLQELMSGNTQTETVDAFIQKLEKICTTPTDPTDANGETTITQAAGLYVFIGGDMPHTVTSHVTPFLVSAPMPKLDGTGWNTDIHVYPKVADNEMTLEKVASQNAQPGKHILVQSGKEIQYTVSATIPGKKDAGALADFTKFELKDTMAAGLTPVYGQGASSFVVKDQNGTEHKFTTKDDEIKVTPPGADNANTTTVTFLDAGLKKLNGLLENGDAAITLTYKAVLGEGATLGTFGNTNNAQLVYQRVGGAVGTLSTTANVHTYGIDVTKELSDGSAVDTNEILFTLTRVEGEKKTPVAFSVKTSGSAGTAKTTYWVDETGSEQSMKVSPDGKLRIYGLLPGTYELEETKSASGYTKLDKPIIIVITAPEHATSYGTTNATATADGQSMKTDGADAFQLTIVNTKQTTGFTLPKTGGEGMLAALVLGFGLVGFAVLVLVSRRKRSNG